MKPELAKVGPAWDGGDIQKWPGVAGFQGVTNHLAHNNNPFLPDPVDSSSSRRGGKKKSKAKKSKRKASKNAKKKSNKSKKRRTMKKQRGGSRHGNTLIPQQLVNLGRNAEYSIERWWSGLTGSAPPVNPDPSKQPIGM
ncbi:MAG: hypothetical protein ACR2M6_03905 [Vampirovibrionia bacterium]|jgi:hypothetical protein